MWLHRDSVTRPVQPPQKIAVRSGGAADRPTQKTIEGRTGESSGS
jgi:hypothetical protein